MGVDMTELTYRAESEVEARQRLPAVPTSYDYAFLYPWQQEALQAWHRNGRKGVIEAVTGAGKTKVGVAAAFEALRQGIKVLVLVPTAELQRQWLSSIARDLPKARRGGLGAGLTQTLDTVDILVAIVHSASTGPTLRSHKAGLLIADECHRYAAPMFAGALQAGYAWRLGLTATYERADGEHENVLSPYFGGVIFRLWYDRALKDGVIAPFDIAYVGVRLTSGERARYDEYSTTMSEAARLLETYAGIPRRPFPAFIAAVGKLAASESASRESTIARRYMRAMASRLTLLADAETKYEALAALKPSVDLSMGTLVFTQTQDSARRAQQLFSELGARASAIYSGMDRDERRQGMADFRSGASQVLAAPRLLDEGIDVPEADLGIVVAANRSQRQMVQRLGRVIRKKADGRAGRLVVLYSKDTVEDPNLRGEEFLGSILPFARRDAYFELDGDLARIEEFLHQELPASGPGSEPGTRESAPQVGESEDGKATHDLPETQETENPAPQGFDLDDEDWPELLEGVGILSDDAVRDYLKRIGAFGLLQLIRKSSWPWTSKPVCWQRISCGAATFSTPDDSATTIRYWLSRGAEQLSTSSTRICGWSSL